MIFNEIYGCYYNVVAKMINLAIDEKLTEKKMNELVREYAFEESLLNIIPAIKNQDWQLIDSEFKTPIVHKTFARMTNLEKRWLKTILLDKRISLFAVPTGELDDVEPLFNNEDIVYFDRYLDGDNYEDIAYIEKFNIIKQAVKEQRKVKIKFLNNRYEERTQILTPLKIEYSDKEDKFRILCATNSDIVTINMGRMLSCIMLDETFSAELYLNKRKLKTLVFEILDERNTLERAMMKFAHYKKQVEKIKDDVYMAKVEYDADDEADLLIQIMSFGSYIKVLSPVEIKDEIYKRLEKQFMFATFFP